MTTAQFVAATFLKSTGKQITFASGSTKWLKIVALGNLYIDQWQDEPNIDWESLRLAPVNIGAVTAASEFTYSTTTIRKLSPYEADVVRILHSDGVAFTDYDIITSARQKYFANGQPTYQDNYVTNYKNKLQFNRAFASTDPQFGGSIYVPAYGYVSHITADADVIPVDIPNWLVFAVAAEYIRTDVTRQPQYGNIVNEANQIMLVMRDNNGGQNTNILATWNPLGATGNYTDQAFA